MAYYYTCPDCGANLDPGEKCDCRKEAVDLNKKENKKEAFLHVRNQNHSSGIIRSN